MIQDFTHVQYFAICLKDFSPSPPSLASHTPPKGFAHCTVLFLLKNPAHKQDKWFKNNPHNKNKWGRGWRSGKEVGGGRGAGMHPFIPSCQWRVVAAAAVSVGLWPLQGTWSLGLSFKGFLFIHNDPKGGRKRNFLSHEDRWVMWKRETISRVVSPQPPRHPAPIVVKNMISHTDSFYSSRADVIWKCGRKHFDRV